MVIAELLDRNYSFCLLLELFYVCSLKDRGCLQYPKAEIRPFEPDAGNSAEGSLISIFCFSNFYNCQQWGALINRAEIIPSEPDQIMLIRESISP